MLVGGTGFVRTLRLDRNSSGVSEIVSCRNGSREISFVSSTATIKCKR